MKKTLLLLVSFALLSLPPAFGQRVYVHVAPPRARIEHPGPRPHPGWVWRDGYHRWDGHRYIWVGGVWVAPPHPGAVWVRGHWQQDPGGWYWVPGHWA